MSRQIFPVEIAEFSRENLFVEHHTRSKIIYSAVIIMIIVTFALLPIIKVNVSKQGRGMITSQIKNSEIYSPVTGEIEDIHIKENQPIAKGDTLFTINALEADEKIQLIKEKIANTQEQIADLQLLLKGARGPKHLQSQKYLYDWIEYDEQRTELNIKKNFAKREYDTHKQLYNEHVISKNEYKEYEYRYQLTKQALSALSEKRKNIWAAHKEQLEQELAEHLTQEVQTQVLKNRYTITSPIDGILKNMSGVQIGSHVNPNQKIIEISSLDSLWVECIINSSDIGLIKKGVPVKYQVDAYNHNLWGLAKGTVEDVSKDVQVVDNQAIFQVWCSIDQSELTLENGYSARLSKGLTLTARFFVVKRSLYQLLYDKMEDWLNPKSNLG